MIKVTDLHGVEYSLNAEQIEKVEQNPDTQIMLLNGHRYYVRESIDEIMARVVQYRADCNAARSVPVAEGQKE
ncbi:flagellar FlbD family protein [Pontiella agarivorans]|uniref:Flagellar FlbD family protein n=1 Tax=Pontiella agarivorans TaxID=3038953 RepID=A0ABU5MSV8_9BACT|nr:flagellar FlbD family protein [Pontiella agarivorans]MDZ8117289.1 flagellar FlbD family protein [Pontiella agarivorans]